MFVSQEQVPVRLPDDAGGNTIFIRAKMSFGVQQRVRGALVALHAGMGQEAAEHAPLNIGAANIALLTHNVVGWAGPAFDGVPCDAEHIEQLDPDEPLVDAVLAEINRRNPGSKDAEKNANTPAANTNGGAPSSRAGGAKR